MEGLMKDASQLYNGKCRFQWFWTLRQDISVPGASIFTTCVRLIHVKCFDVSCYNNNNTNVIQVT